MIGFRIRGLFTERSRGAHLKVMLLIVRAGISSENKLLKIHYYIFLLNCNSHSGSIIYSSVWPYFNMPE